MKGKIEKYTDNRNGTKKYKITYIKTESYNTKSRIDEEDMEEYMDDINEDWEKILKENLHKVCEEIIAEHKEKRRKK